MLILGLETSGKTASVAVSRDGALIAEYALCNNKTHSETVMPIAERLLNDLHITVGQLDAIAVDIGPGSFTGVRIGVCAANAMAAALHIPVVGVDVMHALYEPMNGLLDVPVCVLLDARNGNGYGGLFQAGSCLREAEAVVLEEYIKEMPENTCFIGDGAQLLEAYIKSNVKGARLAPARYACPSASSVCACAWRMQSLNIIEASEETAPLYLRPSQAERMWEVTHHGE